MPTQQLRERTQEEIDRFRAKHIGPQTSEYVRKFATKEEYLASLGKAQRPTGTRGPGRIRPGSISKAEAQMHGFDDYDAQGKFYDPSARNLATAPAPAPIPVPAAPTTVAAAVTPPPALPASAPASIIDLRIAVLQAIKAYEATPTTDTLKALTEAHKNLRTAIMAHRAATGGGGWGGGWRRRHRGHHQRRWMGGGGPWSGDYGWNRGGGWGSKPPGALLPAAAPAPIVSSTATAAQVKGCCGMDDYLQMGDFARGAGMMYADDPLSGEVDNSMNGTLESFAHTLGLSSNLSHWEAGVPLPQVYEKYARWIPSLVAQAKGILGSGARNVLAQKADALYRIWNPLRNAFAEGALPGERDRKRLDELVGATRAFKKDLENAKAEWGWAPVAEEEIAPDVIPQAAPPSSSDGFPTWLLFVPVGLIAMWMFGKKK